MGSLPRGVKKEPFVSVVTPVYNGGAYLAECVASVLAQTHRNFEYVIADNHSTDETASIAASYAAQDERIRVVSPERHLSQTDNFNFTASCAAPTADYLKTVHADDSLLPDCLERMVAIGERHPNVGVIGSRRYIGDDRIDLAGIPPTVEFVPGRWLIRAQLLGGPYTTGAPTSTMIRSSVIRDRVPLYDPAYEHNDDALMYSLLRDVDFGYDAGPLTRTRLHADSRTSWVSRVGTWTPDHLRMVLDFASDILSPAELDAAAGKLEARYERNLLKWTVNLKLVRDREVLRFHREALRAIAESSRRAERQMPATLRLYARVLGSF